MLSVGSNFLAPMNVHLKGFTLLEILVVLALAGLLIAVVPPVMSNMFPSLELRKSAQDLASTLKYSRTKAQVSGKRSELQIDLEKKVFGILGQKKQFQIAEDIAIKAIVADSGSTDTERKVASISFFPDGSSSGGLVELSFERRRFEIGVDWLTGQVRSVEFK